MGKLRLAILYGLASSLLSVGCLSQPARNASIFLSHLGEASQTQNAEAYTALFASDATWEGPFGQNAIGKRNIHTAVVQFFTEFGPLRVVLTATSQFSPDLVMADVYQRTRGRHVSLSPKRIAAGSGIPPQDADVRTTLVLRKQESGWEIIAARVADLRAGNRP